MNYINSELSKESDVSSEANFFSESNSFSGYDFYNAVRIFFTFEEPGPLKKLLPPDNIQNLSLFANTKAIQMAMKDAKASDDGISPYEVYITKVKFPDFYYKLANDLGFEILLYKKDEEPGYLARCRLLNKNSNF